MLNAGKFGFALALLLSATPIAAQSLERQAADIIKSRGYWCEGRVSITPHMFGNTANHSTFRVFCDANHTVATYNMKVARNGSYVQITEK